MSGVTRKGFSSAFANAAIDLQDEGLGAALAGTSLDAGKLDALDGKTDGRVSGQQGLEALYDEINRLDSHTAALSSKQERAVWGALQGATIAPKEISPEQGAAVAKAARQQVAEDNPAPGKLSQWALAGTAVCGNPDLSSSEYAGQRVWKCNVFVGEAFYRAGLPFPTNGESHYVTANNLPSQSRFFRPLTSLDDVRPGDLISIHRDGEHESGHIEIVTSVQRRTNGRIASISSAGAHSDGSAESVSAAAPLVRASRVALQIDHETWRILRPLAPPAAR